MVVHRLTSARLLVLLILYGACSSISLAETFQLSNGGSIEGTIQGIDGNGVTVKTDTGVLRLSKESMTSLTWERVNSRDVSDSQPEAVRYLPEEYLWSGMTNIHPVSGHAKDKELGYWISLLRDSLTIDRALARLHLVLTDEDLPLIHQNLLYNSDGRVRRSMCWLLRRLDPEPSIPVLRKALEDDYLQVRQNAAYCLGVFKAREAVPDLIHSMESDSDTYVRRRAAAALNKIGTPEAMKAIEDLVPREGNGRVRGTLTDLLENPRFEKNEFPRIEPGSDTVGHYKGLRYRIYVPADYERRDALKLLVMVHGTDSTAGPSFYVNWPRAEAERYGFAVLAPRFDWSNYPGFGGLNIGVGEKRPDLVLLELLDELKGHLNIETDRFYIFGHSEGAQFAHRFALTHSERVARGGSSCCGNYVHPHQDLSFPFGMGANPLAPDLGRLDFGNLVRSHYAVSVGAGDNQWHHECIAWFLEEVKNYARLQGIPNNIRKFDNPKGGHDGGSNYEVMKDFLFEELRPRIITEREEPLTFRLEMLTLRKMRQGWGGPQRKKSVSGNPLNLGGKIYEHGVGTHAQSRMVIGLAEGSSRFTSVVGVDAESGNNASVEFLVIADGKKVWSSGLMRKSTPPKNIDLDMSGVETLELKVTDGGDGIGDDHADWADAQFTVTGLTPEMIWVRD